MIGKLLRHGLACFGLMLLVAFTMFLTPFGLLGRGLHLSCCAVWDRIENGIDWCMALAED